MDISYSYYAKLLTACHFLLILRAGNALFNFTLRQVGGTMGSVMLVAREIPEGFKGALALCNLDGWNLIHIDDTARAIHTIKTGPPAELVIIATNCPGAESYFSVLDAAARQKNHGLIILAVNTRNANITIERQLSQNMGATDAIFLARLVEDLPVSLRLHTPERAAS